MTCDIATAIHHTGIDPFTKQQIYVAKALWAAQPPKEAIEARRRRANDPDHYHTVANPSKGEKSGERGAGPVKLTGYRPKRLD